MAILERFEKQPNDVQDYDVDFTDYIESMGELVGSAHTVAAESDDVDLSIDSATITAGVAKVWTSGGTDGVTYKITTTLTTAGGRVKEVEFKVKVKES